MNDDDLTFAKIRLDPRSLATLRDHLAAAQPVEPNRIKETLTPKHIEEIEPDVYLVDFGRNVSGWLEVDLPSLTTASANNRELGASRPSMTPGSATTPSSCTAPTTART